MATLADDGKVADVQKDIELTPLPSLRVVPELESIEQSSALSAAEPPAEQTKAQKRTELIRFLTLLYSFFLLGWQDGSMGPLLPTIRSHYKIGFTAVSSLFIAQCAGAGLSSFSIFFLLDRLGLGKVLFLGALLHGTAAAVQASAPPFPAFAAMSFFIGMGMSLQDATGNGYIASLKRNGSRKMGILHAAYGLGAFSAPLAATPFSSFGGRRWAFLYIVTTAIGFSATILLALVFRFKRMEVLVSETNEPQLNQDIKVEGETAGEKLKNTLKMPLVQFLAFFIALYVGIEVTIGGWVVTFIIETRHGGSDSGFISAGYFGGLMLGRIILLPVNHWIGERRVIFMYATISAVLLVIVWRVPSLIGNAVAVSIVGLLHGPWFPIVMHQAGLILPAHILGGAVGYIAGFAVVGAASVPFITGALASRFEIKVMPIVVLIMTGIIILCWGAAVSLVKKHKVQ